MSDLYPLVDELTNAITRALQADAKKVCDDSVGGLCVDCGVCVEGLRGDSAVTVPVGSVTGDAERLLRVTREALDAGVRQAIIGNHVGDIGFAVQRVAEAAGFSVVRELVGHGIGTSFHEEPQVPNFGKPKRGPRLVAGMTIAIISIRERILERRAS